MILAIINCGIGIQYAENAVSAEKGVGVVAGVFGVIYIAVVVWWYVKRRGSDSEAGRTQPESDGSGYLEK
jgi:hypothetical protein